MSLYENINKRKKAGTSRSKKNSTISKDSYNNMKAGFPKSDARERVQSYRDGGKVQKKSPAWQRAEGKSESGGLNETGRKSYEKNNPGSNLKPPQPEGGSRKKSFCARMGGMKKKLTSSKTANDPNSRINKSLRKWKC
jgi:hypothetical protein|tara:strand:+ start:889 stop:1302 length:414 start_codon:yes stop_codon:yes gene_type:complete